MSGDFDNKNVLITGGGRGMGRVIATQFAAAGANVIIAARTSRYGEQTVADLQQRGFSATLVTGDISERGAVRHMVNSAAQAFGTLDIVVHVAADNALGRVLDMADEDFDYLIRSNIHSAFWIAKDAAPYLSRARDKGRLIYISSAAANRTFMPGLTSYTATKSFLNTVMRGLALELGQQNILVNAVEPGMIATDRMQSHLSAEQASQIAAGFPVPRPGEPEEIAAAVLFLASAQAGYITGTGLLVDGGCSLVPMPGLSSLTTHS